MIFICFSIIILALQSSLGKILPCNQTHNQNQVCSKSQNYVTEISPEPFPSHIKLKLKFYEIISVDESKQTVTLSIRPYVEWIDRRLDVNRTKDYIEK